MDSKHKVQVVLIIAITFFGYHFANEYFSKEKEKDRHKIVSDAITSLKEVNPKNKKKYVK